MNYKIKLTVLTFIGSLGIATAQDLTTVEASSEEISDNLDLEAVASTFGDAKDLADFELRLNDPDEGISNLDLNEDGYVDYLRVVETGEEDTHVIAIQAIIGKDQYQDVATVEVEKDVSGKEQVQVVGDVYIYGSNYIVEPAYVVRPPIFTVFWRPHYRYYSSSWSWGHYPGWYRPWRPYRVGVYHTHCSRVVSVHHHTYYHTTVRRSVIAPQIHRHIYKNDYAVKHPQHAFAKRNSGVKNKAELNAQKHKNNEAMPNVNVKHSGKKVDTKWQTTSKKSPAKESVNNVKKTELKKTQQIKKSKSQDQEKGQKAKVKKVEQSNNSSTRSKTHNTKTQQKQKSQKHKNSDAKKKQKGSGSKHKTNKAKK